MENFIEARKRIFLTASFQSSSVVLIHILRDYLSEISVFFIDTGFHFPETIAYLRKIENLFKIEIGILKSPVSKSEQLSRNMHFLYAINPEKCCYYNKVLPIQKVISNYDVWISGIRREQTTHRRSLKEFEETPEGVLRYHPLINWTKEMLIEYIKSNDLPMHPLDNGNLRSVGCMPCSYLYTSNDREGRWFGTSRKECGLHTYLISSGQRDTNL